MKNAVNGIADAPAARASAASARELRSKPPIPDTIRNMFRGLEHTAIASPDPKKLAQWYVDHLEFKINFEYDGNYFIKASNGTILEIIPSEGGRPEAKMKDPGIRHLAIQVDDFDAAHAHLRRAGVRFLAEP